MIPKVIIILNINHRHPQRIPAHNFIINNRIIKPNNNMMNNKTDIKNYFKITS